MANVAAIDFETTPVFSLTVQVEDTGALSDSATVTVNLADENEPPVASDATFTVSETSPNGQ